MSADPQAIELRSPAQLAFAADKLRSMGQSAHAELFDAARRGLVLVMFAARGAFVSMGLLKRQGRPILVIVGDDDYQSSGPAGWPRAEVLVKWCRRIVVHGAGAEAALYREIAEATAVLGRVLLVETSSDQVQAWRAIAPLKPGLIIVPISGQHPLPETRH